MTRMDGKWRLPPVVIPLSLPLLLIPSASPGNDCNQNGIDDLLDMAPRLEFDTPGFFFTDGPAVLASGDLDNDGDADLALVYPRFSLPQGPGALLVLSNG